MDLNDEVRRLAGEAHKEWFPANRLDEGLLEDFEALLREAMVVAMEACLQAVDDNWDYVLARRAVKRLIEGMKK